MSSKFQSNVIVTITSICIHPLSNIKCFSGRYCRICRKYINLLTPYTPLQWHCPVLLCTTPCWRRNQLMMSVLQTLTAYKCSSPNFSPITRLSLIKSTAVKIGSFNPHIHQNVQLFNTSIPTYTTSLSEIPKKTLKGFSRRKLPSCSAAPAHILQLILSFGCRIGFTLHYV